MKDNNFFENNYYYEDGILLEINDLVLENYEIFEKQINSLKNFDSEYAQNNEITQIESLNEELISKNKFPKEPDYLNPFIHTKFKKDNILRRIKVHFFKFLIFLCNDYIKKIYKKQKFKFKKIENNKIISDVSIRFNLALRQKSLFDVLCDTDKKKRIDSTKNYKLIHKLIEDHEVFRDFFNLKIENLYNFFTLKEITKVDLINIYGLRRALTMEDYIKKQLEDNLDEYYYLEMFRFYALNFFNIFDERYARIRKKTNDS